MTKHQQKRNPIDIDHKSRPACGLECMRRARFEEEEKDKKKRFRLKFP